MGSRPALLPLGDAILADDPAAATAAYSACEFAVFPLHTINDTGHCSCGKACGRNAGKHPRTPNGLLAASRDPDQVRAWWQRWPDANIAVATGEPSGVWVMDIDPAHAGLESVAALEAAHGELTPTWCVETGGDGLHLWFRLAGATLRNSAGRLGPGLDVRATGGYVIVPPSRHRSGGAYHWAAAWHPARVELASAPRWLVDLAGREAAPEMIPPEPAPRGTKLGGNQSPSLPTVITEGARNAALTSLAGVMRHKGCGERAIVAALLVENKERCKPPLSNEEIAAIAHSVCRYAPATVPQRPRSSRSRTFVEFVGGRAVRR